VNDLYRKILSLEAPGGQPAEVHIIAPTIVRPGTEFALKIAVADEMGYPSLECQGRLRVFGDFADPPEMEVDFERGVPAIRRIEGIVIPREGLYRFQGEISLGGQRRTFWSNPVRCRSDGEFIYWGDPHVHTVLSDCHPGRCRSLNFCYIAARWFAGLDWVSVADHVSNGRCTPGKWREQMFVCEAFNDPPNFVTLPAYEASFKGGAGGDNNVYMLRWPDIFVEDYEEGTVKTMCRKLSEKLIPVEEFFVVPHHTTRTGKHGEIGPEIYPGEDLMPVIEIHSKWGTSEYRGNSNPLHKIHPGPSYAVDLLNRGLKLGFIAGTDTHSTMPAGFGDEHLDRLPGLTAVFAEGLTRRSIYEGMRTRNCYAASLERIYLDVRVADVRQGSCINWPNPGTPRRIEATAAARSDIVALEVVRNGHTVYAMSPGRWRGDLEFIDESDLAAGSLVSEYLGRFAYYYVRVTCASGAQAWSSPVWVLL
jgi:hypothetical protein